MNSVNSIYNHPHQTVYNYKYHSASNTRDSLPGIALLYGNLILISLVYVNKYLLFYFKNISYNKKHKRITGSVANYVMALLSLLYPLMLLNFNYIWLCSKGKNRLFIFLMRFIKTIWNKYIFVGKKPVYWIVATCKFLYGIARRRASIIDAASTTII